MQIYWLVTGIANRLAGNFDYTLGLQIYWLVSGVAYIMVDNWECTEMVW